MTHRLGQRGGDLPHFRGKVLRPLGHIDADAQLQVLHPAGLPLQGELRQDAADLPAAQHRVVGPLQAGTGAADPLYGPAHRHTGHGRHRGQPLRRQVRPQQSRQIDPLAAGGLEAPAQAAPAGGLEIRRHHGAVRRPLRRQLFGAEIGGVHLRQADQGPAHPGRLPQEAPDLRLRQGVRSIQQAVAPAGAGLHRIALPPQGVHRLPDGGAAQSQAVADLLAGDIVPLPLPQQRQNVPSAHMALPSPDVSAPESIMFSPGCKPPVRLRETEGRRDISRLPQSSSSSIRLSPYTGMPWARSSAAVTPSPAVSVPVKVPS